MDYIINKLSSKGRRNTLIFEVITPPGTRITKDEFTGVLTLCYSGFIHDANLNSVNELECGGYRYEIEIYID